MKTVTVVPKDSCGERLELNVITWYHSHNAFTFVLSDGTTRIYPDCHVWYVSTK